MCVFVGGGGGRGEDEMSRKCRGELWEREGVLLPIQLSRGMTKIDKLS